MDYEIKILYKAFLKHKCTVKNIGPTDQPGINVIELDNTFVLYTYKTSMQKVVKP